MAKSSPKLDPSGRVTMNNRCIGYVRMTMITGQKRFNAVKPDGTHAKAKVWHGNPSGTWQTRSAAVDALVEADKETILGV